MTTPTTGARKAHRRRIKKTDWGYIVEKGATGFCIAVFTALAIAVLILIYAVAEEAYNHLDDPEHPFSGATPDSPTDYTCYDLAPQYQN